MLARLTIFLISLLLVVPSLSNYAEINHTERQENIELCIIEFIIHEAQKRRTITTQKSETPEVVQRNTEELTAPFSLTDPPKKLFIKYRKQLI